MNKYKYFIFFLFFLVSASGAFAQNDRDAMEEALAQILNKYSLQADTLAKRFSKTHKKDADMQVRIARSYHRNRDDQKANEYIEKALKVKEGYGPAFILQGDIYAFNQDSATATGFYKRAMDEDPKNPDGYLKYIDAVTKKDPQAAVSALENMKLFIPEYPAALAQATIWFQNQKFDKAIEAYAQVDSTKMDVDTYANYAFSYYFSQKYDESLKLAHKADSLFPKNFRLQRIMLYDYAEKKDYKKALTYADKVLNFVSKNEKEKANTLDYTYYGMACRGVNKLGDAMFKFAQFVNDTTNSPQDIANIHAQAKGFVDGLKAGGLYDDAAKNYTIYLNARKGSTDYDYFSVTEIYRAQAEDAIALNTDLEQAYHQLDSIYNIFEVTHSKWDQLDAVLYYHAVYCTSMLDPSGAKGLAVPLYEKLINYESGRKLTSRENNLLKNAYIYLAYYNYNNGHKITAKSYARKALQIDPNNANAKRLL